MKMKMRRDILALAQPSLSKVRGVSDAWRIAAGAAYRSGWRLKTSFWRHGWRKYLNESAKAKTIAKPILKLAKSSGSESWHGAGI